MGDEGEGKARAIITDLLSWSGGGALLLVLSVCYFFSGPEFTGWVAAGVLLGFSIALMGLWARNGNHLRFSIRSLCVLASLLQSQFSIFEHTLIC